MFSRPILAYSNGTSLRPITLQEEERAKTILLERARRPFIVGGRGILDNEGYCDINPEEIFLANYLYRAYPTFRIAYELNASNLANGGLTIRVGKAEQKNFKTQDLFGKTIMGWAQTVLRHFYLFGFAVCSFAPVRPELKTLYSPDTDSFGDLGGEEPKVLQPDQVRIRVRRNVLGEYDWVVQELPSMTNGQLEGREIPHVYVFTYPGSEPDGNGRLNSTVLAAVGEFLRLEVLQQSQVQAAIRNASPAVITERVNTDNRDRLNLHGLVGYHGDDVCMDDGYTEEETNKLRLQEQIADRMLRLRQRLTPGQYLASQNEAQIAINSQMNDYPGPRVDLPMDRKVARQITSSAPSDLAKAEVLFEEHILASFGIPPAMLLAESTSGRSTLNENARDLYGTTLARLKQQMMVPIQVMLRAIYTRYIAARVLLRTKKPMQLQQLREATDIQVTLPGIPPENLLHEWYDKGLLTYEAYVDYLAAIHCIPREAFEDKAPPPLLLPQPDENGVMKKKPSGAKPKSKKRKK